MRTRTRALGGQDNGSHVPNLLPRRPLLCCASRYSITISIFVLFCVVKSFAYFGILDFDD